jgi:hypothetical protein
MASPLGLTFDLSKNGPSVGRPHKVFEGGGAGQKVKSLFNNASVFSPFPIGAVNPQTGTPNKIKTFSQVHNNDIYDTSISSIIKYTSKKPSMKLDFIDFAYLRYLGVYPNNRLIVARRFGAGVGNDLNNIKTPPLAKLVSWIPETEENFLSVSYNELYVDADASYVEVLNEIGKDTRLSKDDPNAIGDFAAGGLSFLPFPGLTEPLQRAVMAKFGLVDDPYNLPLGNPNLIREARRRKTVTKDQAGSGLACTMEIKMVVEYEQKFINGVDPSLVYLDIIQNAIYFGTSDAAFQMGKGFATGANKILQNLISGDYKAIYDSLEKIVGEIFAVVRGAVNDLVEAFINPPDENLKEQGGKIKAALRGAFAVGKEALGAVIGKYKHRLMGITNALTGSPSTPWHITIGNPKKPIFSSGDMELTKVNLDLGKVLAFNDLPSTIKITLSFQNARPLGAQEIFNRLNSGIGRTSIVANIQTETPRKNDGTIDQSAGPQKQTVVTKTFDASPSGGESATFSDVLYATTDGDGVPYYSYNDPDNPSTANSGTIADTRQPVNVGEATVNDQGKLQNPNSANQPNLQPSAQSGNGAPASQPIPAATSQATVPAVNTPLTTDTAKQATDRELTARRNRVNEESAQAARDYASLSADPGAQFDPTKQNQLANVKAKMTTLNQENKMIQNEQKSRRA